MERTFFMLTKKNILFVDGDEGMRKSLSLFFQSHGYPLVAIENAKQALMEIHKKKFDIIICETLLPDMNGLNFFEIIKSRCCEAIKILIVPYGDNMYQEDITKKNIDYVITKPFTGDEIEATVVSLVNSRDV